MTKTFFLDISAHFLLNIVFGINDKLTNCASSFVFPFPFLKSKLCSCCAKHLSVRCHDFEDRSCRVDYPICMKGSRSPFNLHIDKIMIIRFAKVSISCLIIHI